MQVPSSCGWREDVTWGVATVLAALLVLPLIPVAVALSAASEVTRRASRW